MTKYRKAIPLEIRKEVKAVYNNQCAVCSTRQLLQIHHLDNNAENNNFDNLILLCAEHHAEQHPEKYEKMIEWANEHQQKKRTGQEW